MKELQMLDFGALQTRADLINLETADLCKICLKYNRERILQWLNKSENPSRGEMNSYSHRGWPSPAAAWCGRTTRGRRRKRGRRGARSYRPSPRTRWQWQNFDKMLLVFGCISTDFFKKICVLQHSSESTRLSSCNFWNLASFCKFCNICQILLNFHRNWWFFKPIFC